MSNCELYFHEDIISRSFAAESPFLTYSRGVRLRMGLAGSTSEGFNLKPNKKISKKFKKTIKSSQIVPISNM